MWTRYHLALSLIIIFILILGLHWNLLFGKSKPLIRSSEPVSDKTLLKILTKVWTQHFVYTRLAVEAFFTGSPELPAILQKLKQNQIDIGAVFGDIYGPEVGSTITAELTKHINLAVALLKALKTGDSKSISKAKSDFYANAKFIGDYLDILTAKTGPETKVGSRFRHHMIMHIDTLIANVTAFVAKDYRRDVETLDAYLNAGIGMVFDMI